MHFLIRTHKNIQILKCILDCPRKLIFPSESSVECPVSWSPSRSTKAVINCHVNFGQCYDVRWKLRISRTANGWNNNNAGTTMSAGSPSWILPSPMPGPIHQPLPHQHSTPTHPQTGQKRKLEFIAVEVAIDRPLDLTWLRVAFSLRYMAGCCGRLLHLLHTILFLTHYLCWTRNNLPVGGYFPFCKTFFIRHTTPAVVIIFVTHFQVPTTYQFPSPTHIKP